MKLCYDCLDERDGVERAADRRTTYSERCDSCHRIEADNPSVSLAVN